jgi:hypothetical protein
MPSHLRNIGGRGAAADGAAGKIENVSQVFQPSAAAPSVELYLSGSKKPRYYRSGIDVGRLAAVENSFSSSVADLHRGAFEPKKKPGGSEAEEFAGATGSQRKCSLRFLLVARTH